MWYGWLRLGTPPCTTTFVGVALCGWNRHIHDLPHLRVSAIFYNNNNSKKIQQAINKRYKDMVQLKSILNEQICEYICVYVLQVLQNISVQECTKLTQCHELCTQLSQWLFSKFISISWYSPKVSENGFIKCRYTIQNSSPRDVLKFTQTAHN